MNAWLDDPRLRLTVLEQLTEHARRGRLEPLILGGERVELYGWGKPRDLPALERALGIPANLLVLGLNLFEGFPEDAVGTRDHIEGAQTFLQAAAVGVSLSGVVPSFVCWRLVEEPVWPDLPALVRDLLLRAALTVLEGIEDPALEQELDDERERWTTRARQLVGAATSDLHDTVAALHAAAAACAQLRNPAAASGLAAAHVAIVGCPPPPSWSVDASQQEQAMRDKLLTLMRQAAYAITPTTGPTRFGY